MAAHTLLVCNGCDAEFRLSPPRALTATRLAAKRLNGWGYWKRGVDYCPTCLAEAVARRKAEGAGYA
jgi:hypothetical protein